MASRALEMRTSASQWRQPFDDTQPEESHASEQQRRRAHIWARNILIYRDLEHALQVLESAGVAVMLLKGVALAQTIYPTIADRPMADVDLLVHPCDRDRAGSALVAAGYRVVPEPEQRFSPFDTEFTGEMVFRRGHGVWIEVHWELTPAEWMRHLIALDMEALWRDAIPLQVNGQRALQLSPPDTLLHLCLHLAVHGFRHPWGQADICRLIAHYSPFPWQQFVTRACAFRVRSLCYFVLQALPPSNLALVPHHVLDALRPPGWQRRVVRHLADPQAAMAGRTGMSRSRSYLVHFAVVDRPVDGLRTLAWLLFPGRRWLAERYRLRGRLQPWLACFWHPMSSCGKWRLRLEIWSKQRHSRSEW